MRRLIVCCLALASMVGISAAARADGPTTTVVDRVEHIAYPDTGCHRFTTIHERYHLRYVSTTYADGRYASSRSMRGTIRFRDAGRTFRGRFRERARTREVTDPGSYRFAQRVRASTRDGTTLSITERERMRLPADGAPTIVSRTFHRTCS